MVKSAYFRWEKAFLALWFLVNLGIGIITVDRYGMSVDEFDNHRYGSETLQAYPSWFGFFYEPKYDPSYQGHGPAFVGIATVFIGVIQGIFPRIAELDLWHLTYFITFLCTGVCLYWLIRRWSTVLTAWGILFLFTFQPLLWGHSFINPKDIPFTFFFTLSIVLGFRMIDRSIAAEAIPFEFQFVSLIHSVRQNKLQQGFQTVIRNTWRQVLQLGRSFQWSSVKRWLVECWIVLRQPAVLAAGVSLGLATAVRPIAPYAGAIILLYLCIRARSRAWIPAVAYFLVAAITAYVAWPHLWRAPIQRYFESLRTVSSFPDRGMVLFLGYLYSSDQLPRKFFPTLLALQLTEPALILIFVGAVASLYLLLRGKKLEPILLVFLWFVVPASWAMLSRPTLYDNARQLLFLWPALFILAGLGLDLLFHWLKPSFLKFLLIIILVLPGIYSIAHLYPYEYIYYNSLTGGVRGAYRNFELDYWNTSFREAMDYLNKNAEPGTRIMVVGSSTQVARDFARNNLVVTGVKRVTKSDPEPYYLLASTRGNEDFEHCKKAQVVATIEREGAILSYVKFINAGQNCK